MGNTENLVGNDVANIAANEKKVDSGWMLNGSKSYVTNGCPGSCIGRRAVGCAEAGYFSGVRKM